MDRELKGFLQVRRVWIEAFGTANTNRNLMIMGDFL